MADHCSAADCAEGVNDSGRRLLCHAVVTLFAEKCLIHVLRAVRHGVKRRHQQNHVKKKRPVAFEHNQKLASKNHPSRAAGVTRQAIQARAPECKAQERRQRACDEETAPAEERKHDPINDRRQQITERIALLQNSREQSTRFELATFPLPAKRRVPIRRPCRSRKAREKSAAQCNSAKTL